jgi:NitT/TauT family transport system ATP-binding protein
VALDASPGEYVICRRVGKVFETGKDRIEAIGSAHLRVADGEFVSILGPSGCGKSTLLMMIGGLDTPTSGEIIVAGRSMSAPRPEIGIMFQDPTLLPWKTVLDNVLFPVVMMRRPIARYRERALDLLQGVGLKEFTRTKPRQLSGGMRQRVAICRALVHEPRLLLMDEPFSALDAITRDEMNIALLDIWDRHKITAIFVTHSIREAVFLSDRVLVMGGRPSTFLADVEIPLRRPRDASLGESADFNAICGHLRRLIGEAHAARK